MKHWAGPRCHNRNAWRSTSRRLHLQRARRLWSNLFHHSWAVFHDNPVYRNSTNIFVGLGMRGALCTRPKTDIRLSSAHIQIIYYPKKSERWARRLVLS